MSVSASAWAWSESMESTRTTFGTKPRKLLSRRLRIGEHVEMTTVALDAVGFVDAFDLDVGL